MRKILLTVLFFSLFVNAFAQRKSIDSLKRLIATVKNDTDRVDKLNELGYLYGYSKPDSDILYSQQALQLAKDIAYTQGESSSLLQISAAFSSLANYPKALSYELMVLKLSEQIHSPENVATALSNIGAVYALNGEYALGINYLKRGIAYATAINNQVLLLNSLASTGDTYEKMNLLDSAMVYNRKACSVARKLKDQDMLGLTFNNMANVYTKLSQLDTALYYYRLAVPLYKQSSDDSGVCEATLGMANVFKRLGQTDSSLYYARQSIQSGWKGGFTGRVMNASKFLTAYFKQQGRFDSAFRYQEILIAAKDSIFSQEKSREIQNLDFAERQRQLDNVTKEAAYKARIRYYLLMAAIAFMMVLAFVFWRNSRHRQKANLLLTRQNEEIEKQKMSAETTLTELKTTQTQLVQSAKMASLGELTAGIAHEIQNPLNFVNNFSEVSAEMMEELNDELDKGDVAEAKAIATDITQNLQKITHHGKRADFIVKGMLEHSRTTTGEKTLTNINVLAEEFLKLSYHGIRAKDKSINAELVTNFDNSLPKMAVAQQDIGRVLLNLINNAFYAVNQKQKIAGPNYKPTITITTFAPTPGGWGFSIKDNGNGIPDAIKEKIMQPFFTTKPTGEGTGLGLSLSYDIIVKGHGGNFAVNTKEGEYAEFVVEIPAKQLM